MGARPLLILYADTSFLVPLYAPDVHSSTAAAIMGRTEEAILITPCGEAELCNAIQLRVFRKTLSADEAQVALRAFDQDILSGAFAVRPFLSTVFELAKRLSVKHTPSLGTRSLDLMHVASALRLEATAFLSFDQNQRKLTHAAGLTLQPRTLAHLA